MSKTKARTKAVAAIRKIVQGAKELAEAEAAFCKMPRARKVGVK